MNLGEPEGGSGADADEGASVPPPCDSCGTVSTAKAGPRPGPREGPYVAVLADSSWIDPVDPAQDGRRPVVACSGRCLDRVRAVLASRPYTTVELWAGKVARAVTASQGPPVRAELERATGLTPPQIRAAYDWLEEHGIWLERHSR
ncbi:hypothetical protein [Streptodolium elevatio]